MAHVPATSENSRTMTAWDQVARLLPLGLIVAAAGAGGIMAAIWFVGDPFGVPADIVIGAAVALWGFATVAGVLELTGEKWGAYFALGTATIASMLLFISIVSAWWYLVPILGAATFVVFFGVAHRLEQRNAA